MTGVGLVGAMLSSGCQQAAAVATAQSAVKVVQLAAVVVDNIPKTIQDAADLILSQNNLSWGRPEKVIVTDTNYVFLYPTNASQLRLNNGIPRMVVINRTDNLQPQPN